MRTKNVDWLEGKIIYVLSRESEGKSDAGLLSLVLKNYGSKVEEDNFDIAVQMLLSRRLIYRGHDDGVTTYRLKRAG